MNSYLLEKMKSSNCVYLYDKDKNPIDTKDIEKHTEFYLTHRTFVPDPQKIFVFTFEDYMISPFSGFDFNVKFNKGINIPLVTMKGTIKRQVGKMYSLDLQGVLIESKQCLHCLKSIDTGCVCNDCLLKLGVNQIEDVTWQGFVPIKSCKEIKEWKA